MNPNHRRLVQIFLDLICLLLTGIFPLILKLGLVNPYQRGFFCDDETLKHPYHGNTVDFEIVSFFAFALPLFTMILIETILYRQGYSCGYQPLQIGKLRINACVVNIVAKYAVYIFGLGVNQTFTDATKVTIGRLRPHFFDVCKPDYSLFNCSAGYITLDVCTGSGHRMHDARMSFLSGHTSVSVYTALYVAIYLQARMLWTFSRLLKHILQVIFVLMAWLCALSRISDYKHHPEDVAMGAILGIGVCITVVLFLSDLPSPTVASAFQYEFHSMSGASQRKVSTVSRQSNTVNSTTTGHDNDVELG